MKSIACVIIPKCVRPWVDLNFVKAFLYSEYLHRKFNRFLVPLNLNRLRLRLGVYYSEYLHWNLNRFILSPQVFKSKLTKANLKVNLLLMKKLLKFEFSLGTLGNGNLLTPLLHPSKSHFQLLHVGHIANYFHDKTTYLLKLWFEAYAWNEKSKW